MMYQQFLKCTRLIAQMAKSEISHYDEPLDSIEGRWKNLIQDFPIFLLCQYDTLKIVVSVFLEIYFQSSVLFFRRISNYELINDSTNDEIWC